MKKKILFHSNYHKLFTGFGKNAKNILSYLYKTGKYELVELANGKAFNDPELSKLPWRAIGTLPRPDQALTPEEQKKPEFQRNVAYGQYGIDKIITEEKPDIYLGVEDIWAFDGYWKKRWWNKVNCGVWTTLDSLPILQVALDAAPKIHHYFTWASFASKKMNELGHTHVKTLNGSIDTSKFYRLKDGDRLQLRDKYSLGHQDFIIGFVFRNQLRKSAPNLLDGFKLFLENNPQSKAKLLLHTHWGEGWDIPRLLKEKGIDPSLVLTTYFCKQCKQYEIKPFTGQGQTCKFCGTTGSQETTNITHGVSDKQLNEIYNLMDVYCHPFTSGGMEIPVFEAKLTELITLVTNYSCGEDSCTPESGGLPLSWSEYREPGTQFIKATTRASSICEQLEKVFKTPLEKRRELEVKAREFVVKNYSIEVIGKKLEDLFDSMPPVVWDFDLSTPLRDPHYNPAPCEDPSDWLVDLYTNILKVENVEKSDAGLQGWIHQLNQGRTRENVLQFFRETAFKENQEIQKPDFESFLGEEGNGKRLAVVISGGVEEVYLVNSLFESLSHQYPDYKIYAILNPNFFPLIDSNPFIYKCVPYSPQCAEPLLLEGNGQHKGYFELVFYPEATKDKHIIHHNGLDKNILNFQEA